MLVRQISWTKKAPANPPTVSRNYCNAMNKLPCVSSIFLCFVIGFWLRVKMSSTLDVMPYTVPVNLDSQSATIFPENCFLLFLTAIMPPTNYCAAIITGDEFHYTVVLFLYKSIYILGWLNTADGTKSLAFHVKKLFEGHAACNGQFEKGKQGHINLSKCVYLDSKFSL